MQMYSLTGCCDANGAVALYGGANKATSSGVQLQTGDALWFVRFSRL
jgi:hypothetical protein